VPIEEGRGTRDVISAPMDTADQTTVHGRGVLKCGCGGKTIAACAVWSAVIYILAQIWRQQLPCHSLYTTYYHFMAVPYNPASLPELALSGYWRIVWWWSQHVPCWWMLCCIWTESIGSRGCGILLTRGARVGYSFSDRILHIAFFRPFLYNLLVLFFSILLLGLNSA